MKSSEKSPPAQKNAAPAASATVYRLKVPAIRLRQQQPRLYVYFPLPLAAAIGLRAGESVQWEVLDRGELHLVREQSPPPRAHKRARP